MNTKQIIGLLLLIAGAGAILYGTNALNSLEYELSVAFENRPTNVTLLIWGGAFAALTGIILLVNHKGGEQNITFNIQTSTTRLVHTIFASIALIAFLFFPITTLGNKIVFTGIDIFNKSDELSWRYVLLFITFFLVSAGNILLGIVPIRQRKIEEQRRDRIYASILMFFPLLGAYLLLADQKDYLNVGNGLIYYAIASFIMILCNNLFEDEDTVMTTQTKNS